MIMGYVRYELSYDKSYSNHNQVYRLVSERKTKTIDETNIGLPTGLAPVLQKEFPSIIKNSIVNVGDFQFKYHNNIITLKTIEGETDFFKLFNLPFLKGNPATALKEPGSIVIEEKTAGQFFKGREAIGSYITENTGKTYHITGIIKDIPSNMHITGDAIVSLTGEAFTKEPLNWSGYTEAAQYILLNKSADPKRLENQLKSIYKKYKFPENTTIQLQPVTDIHLYSHTEDELSPNSDIKYIYIFLTAALLILFIACINYINLTTARSLHRAKEIGLRKVLGALKRQLITQFLTESILFFCISTFLAVLIAYTVWPAFSANITSYQLALPLFDVKSVGAIFLILLLGGLLAGAYPAFFLSSLKPVKILKGLSKYGINISIRKALVVLQFTISGALIIITIVIYQQLNYISNARLGFNKDHLLTIPYHVKNAEVASFKNELSKNSDIQSITVANWTIGTRYGGSSTMADKKDTTKELKFNFIESDPDFIKTIGIHLINGRNFSGDHSNDLMSIDSLFKMHLNRDEFSRLLAAKSIILNQEAVKTLGLANPDGTILKEGGVQGTVIGVVQDFNGLTLHQKIPAIIIRCSKSQDMGQMFIRISPHNTQKTINYIESKWKSFYPNYSCDLVFADEKLQQLYSSDKRTGTLFATFASLGVIIACFGLFGLISLTIQNRVKEIGIRKVLGASVFNIASLISVDFLKLVLLSFVISSPIAWYFMSKWLQDFAYRVDIHWWVFVLACGIALIISVITLSFQSIKAAVANPVDSLRSE